MGDGCSKGHSIFQESCRACRALKKEWYAELKDQGFHDIEKNDRLSDHQSIQDFQARKNFQTQMTYNATVSYYQWARSKLSEGWFTSHRDMRIWGLHSEGLSGRKISEAIGLDQSRICRKLKVIEQYLTNNSVASMSCQLALF